MQLKLHFLAVRSSPSICLSMLPGSAPAGVGRELLFGATHNWRPIGATFMREARFYAA